MVNQAVKPKVSKEEEKYRKSNYADVSKVLNKNPLCTSCNGPVKSMIINGKPLVHPFLETLLCEKCYSFYGDGNFSVDEDGSDKYCRWCGQGGTLYLCSSCTAGFCKKCIKRNLSRSILKDVEGSDWDCFCCRVKPLYDLRAQAWAALQHSQNAGAQVLKRKSRAKSSRRSDSDGDSDYKASHPSKRSSTAKALPKKPVLSFEEKAYKLALSKQNEFLTEIINVCDTVKRKAEEIKNKKLSKRATDSINVETIEVFHNKIISVFDLFKQILQDVNDKTEGFLPEWKKTLEKALEEDKNNKESDLVENGDLKKSKKSDDETEEASSSKRKSRSRKAKDSDEGSDGDKKKSTKAGKDSEDESEEEAKPKTRPKRSTAKDSDDESEESKPKTRPKRSTAKDSDDESEEETKSKTRSKKTAKDSDDEWEEEETKSKTRSKKNAKDSDEESEEETKSKTRSKRNAKDSDEESEEETKSKTRSKKTTKDSDEESEEETKSKTRSKKSAKDSDEESSTESKFDELLSKTEKSNSKKAVGSDESEEDVEMSKDEDKSNKSTKRKRSCSDSEDRQSKQSLLSGD